MIWDIFCLRVRGIWSILRHTVIHRGMWISFTNLLKVWRQYALYLVFTAHVLSENEAIQKQLKSLISRLGVDINDVDLMRKYQNVFNGFMKGMMFLTLSAMIGEFMYPVWIGKVLFHVTNQLLCAHIFMAIMGFFGLFIQEKMARLDFFSKKVIQRTEKAWGLGLLGYVFLGFRFKNVVFVDAKMAKALNGTVNWIYKKTGMSLLVSLIQRCCFGLWAVMLWLWRNLGFSWTFSMLKRAFSAIYLDKVFSLFLKGPLNFLKGSYGMMCAISWNGVACVVASGLVSYAIFEVWRFLKPKLMNLTDPLSDNLISFSGMVLPIFERLFALSACAIFAYATVKVSMYFMMLLIPLSWPIKIGALIGYMAVGFWGFGYSGLLEQASTENWTYNSKLIVNVLMALIQIFVVTMIPMSFTKRVLSGLFFLFIDKSFANNTKFSARFCTVSLLIFATKLMMDLILPMRNFAKLIVLLWHIPIISTFLVCTKFWWDNLCRLIGEDIEYMKKEKDLTVSGDATDSLTPLLSNAPSSSLESMADPTLNPENAQGSMAQENTQGSTSASPIRSREI